MILPIAHERCTVRRWPWVTMSIIVINLVAFGMTWGLLESDETRRADAASTAAGYHRAHPYLVAPPDLREITIPSREPPATDDARSEPGRPRAQGGGDQVAVDHRRRHREQRILDSLVAKMRQAQGDRIVARYGYVPAEGHSVGLVTSAFLHVGWLPLLLNLWFLWLAGLIVEGRWGRLVWGLFYLSAATAGALTHRALNPDSTIPVVGASAVVAAAMGALIVRFGLTSIRFAYWLWPRPRTLWAPAYLVLPLWILKELVDWQLWGQGSEIAYGADLGGFAYGAIFALVAKVAKLEEAGDRRPTAGKTSRQDPAVLAAAQLIDQGRAAEALGALDELGVQRPNDVGVRVEMLRAAQAVRAVDRETRAYVELIGLHLREDSEDVAVKLYREMVDRGLELALTPALRLKVARRMERQGSWPAAAHEYQKLHSGSLEDETAFQALLAHAFLSVRRHRKEEALELYEKAERSQSLHLGLEATVEQGLRAARALPDDGSEVRGSLAPTIPLAPAAPPPPSIPPERRQSAAAAPTLLSSRTLSVEPASANSPVPVPLPTSSSERPSSPHDAVSLTRSESVADPDLEEKPFDLARGGPQAPEPSQPRPPSGQPHTLGPGLAGLCALSRARTRADVPRPPRVSSDANDRRDSSADREHAAVRTEGAGRYSLTPKDGSDEVTLDAADPDSGSSNALAGAGRYSLSSRPPCPSRATADGTDRVALRRSRTPLIVETISLDRASRRPLPGSGRPEAAAAPPAAHGSDGEQPAEAKHDPRRD